MPYTFRALLRTPAFTIVALLTIAIGIAANAAIFSVINGVLLQPLPFAHESRLIRIWTTTASEQSSNHAAGDFLDLQRRNRSLDAVAGFREEVAAIARPGGEPAQLEASWVTADFFDVLGTPAALGRAFTAAQDRHSGERLVELSHQAWHDLFASDPAAVGRSVRINGQTFTVAGVMPPGFAFPDGARLWLLSPTVVPPSPFDVTDPLSNRDVRYFDVIGRVRSGLSIADAQTDLHLVAKSLQRDFPDSAAGRDLRVVPLREDLTGNVRDALIVLQAAVGLVLLIACANVSSLLIARATGRRRELAIRAALGAGRAQLMRQLLAESMVIGITGGLLGLLLASWLVRALLSLVPEGLPRAQSIGLDWTVAAVTIAASLATGLLFGALPALQASRTHAAAVIKAAGDRGSGRARGRSALVVAEIALTLVLLVGAGLLATSFLRLSAVESGFRVPHVTVAELFLPDARYPTGADQTAFYRRLVDALAARSELQASGIGFPAPLHGANAGGAFLIEGRNVAGPADQPTAQLGMISGGYFAAMGIPLISGRTFSADDARESVHVAIVSAALAKKYWPGGNAVGKRIRFDDKAATPWITIVGLAADTRQLGLAEAPPPLLYVPYTAFPLGFTTVVARSTLPEAAVVSLLRSQLAGVDPSLSFGATSSLQSVLARSVEEPRFRATLVGAFAGLALLLAAVGVYGLISYTVTQRTREIGIRVALGAAPRQVLGAIVRDGLTLAVAGIGIGLAAALIAARGLSSLLFGVGASDPLTFAVVAVLLLVIAAAASYIPSRRALRVNPIVALRAE